MSLPLQGIRVLDLSRLLPGGFCSLLLADFGAEVLKVEDTGMGDYIRWSPPYYEGAHESARSALFLALNRNKRSIRLDLKSERGREALLRLVARIRRGARVLQPGRARPSRVGYERMREHNPGLVYCAISGYGQAGPKRDASGHDMNYLGLIGLLGLTGELGGEPVQAAGQIADLGGGALMAAFGILAALRERDGCPGRPGSGEGQLVDVSMADGALSWLAMVAGAYFADGSVPRRGDLPLAGSLICYRPYECSDGWVSLGALEPKFWQAWCRGVGREELTAAQFERPGSAAHAQVQEIFRGAHARGVGVLRLRARLLPGARARARRGAPLRARARARDGGRDRAARRAGERSPAGHSREARAHAGRARTPSRARRSASTPRQVLLAAGYSEAQVAELLASGAAAGPADSRQTQRCAHERAPRRASVASVSRAARRSRSGAAGDRC